MLLLAASLDTSTPDLVVSDIQDAKVGAKIQEKSVGKKTRSKKDDEEQPPTKTLRRSARLQAKFKNTL